MPNRDAPRVAREWTPLLTQPQPKVDAEQVRQPRAPILSVPLSEAPGLSTTESQNDTRSSNVSVPSRTSSQDDVAVPAALVATKPCANTDVADWSAWEGDNSDQQPRLPGTNRYRVATFVSLLLSLQYIVYRACSMPRVSYLSHVVFFCECIVAVCPVLIFITRWDFTDTRGTTPSLDDLANMGAVSTPSSSSDSDKPDAGLPMEAWPTVAVLICVYTEGPETIEPSLKAALSLNYPQEKMHIVMCDDASEKQRREQSEEGKDWLHDLCNKLDDTHRATVTHLRRRKPPGYEHHAKAGNINGALGIWGNGDGGREDWPGGDAILTPKGWDGIKSEFFCIMDADMRMDPQFLQRTMPFFFNAREGGGFTGDNRVSMVQVPQRFENIAEGDPLDHSMTMNYDCNMCAFDAALTVNCCGTGCVFRTSAMMGAAPPNVEGATGMSPPGMQYGSLIEDVHTSMILHCHGWVARYINEDLQTGLAPHTLEETFTQRIRWINGGAQIVRLRYLTGDTCRALMNFQQKTAWTLWFGTMNVIVPVRILLMFVPLFVLYFHNRMYSFSGIQFIDDLAYCCGPGAILMMIASIAAQPGDAPFWLLVRDVVSQMTYMPVMCIGLITMITNRPLKFVTTNKDDTSDVNVGRYHFSLWFHAFFFTLYVTLLAKVAWLVSAPANSLPEWMIPPSFNTGDKLVVLITVVWLVVGLAMFEGVISAVLKPIPARRKLTHNELCESMRASCAHPLGPGPLPAQVSCDKA